MATERRRQWLLGAVVVVLATIIYRMWPGTSAVPAAASNSRGSGTTTTTARQQAPAGPAQATQGTKGSTSAPVVRLGDLSAERPTPGAADRNLFRFKPKAPPPPPPEPPRSTQPTAPVNPMPQPPPGPPPPPPLPPITLKFIGIMEAPTTGQRIAVLSDGRNPPFQGVEGAIIEGRYRILKIGVESIELAYVDGRGRQTIRLTGS